EFVVEKKLPKANGEWITDFVKTAPGYGEEEGPVLVTGNPQTDLLLELLKLPHVVTAPFVSGASTAAIEDPNEINLEDEDDVEEEVEQKEVEQEEGEKSSFTSAEVTAESSSEPAEVPAAEPPVASVDPCEIDLDM
ncbi:hypothetical protein BBJ28_00013407, partial [Nothophytophthora sp. Chile5]